MKNITLITLAVTALAAISLNSCGIYDPEYQAWRSSTSFIKKPESSTSFLRLHTENNR